MGQQVGPSAGCFGQVSKKELVDALEDRCKECLNRNEYLGLSRDLVMSSVCNGCSAYLVLAKVKGWELPKNNHMCVIGERCDDCQAEISNLLDDIEDLKKENDDLRNGIKQIIKKCEEIIDEE